MDKSKLLEFADKFGLQRVAKQIAPSAEEVIQINSVPTNDTNIPLGKSKFGGNPDVPNDFKWPEWKDVNLAFILQLNLAEIPQLPTTSILPKTGILSFFYHPNHVTWGFDPKDIGSWRTYYFQEENLHREISPVYKSTYMEKPYIPCSVEFVVAESYPSPFSEFISQLDLSDKEEEAYWGFYLDESQPRHQLLGHPDIVQNPMELECELVTNGIYTGDGKWLNHPKLQEYKQNSRDWRLLLQIDSDDKTGMMWGDVGMLYFWLKEEMIKRELFTETWMILQCT